MQSQWIPFLAITAAVINAAVIGLLNDPRNRAPGLLANLFQRMMCGAHLLGQAWC